MSLHPIWPLWAVLLVALPLVLVCLVMLLRRKDRRIAWLRRLGIALAVGVIAIGPSTMHTTASTVQSNAEIFFVVDRTGSMAAEDYDGTSPRLDGVRHDLDAIVDAFPGARYSIIAWDSQATRQLPLTTDARAVKSWADTVRQELTSFSTGSQVDRPLGALSEALAGAAERNPSNVRLVYFLSDGENTDGEQSSSSAQLESFAPLAPLVDGGAVLGYGTTEGGRMKVWDGFTPTADAPYITDPTNGGAEAVSRIDEETLRTIAEQLGVEYVHRITPDTVEGFTSGIDVQEISADGRREHVIYQPVVWPFATLALVLLVWESFAIARTFPVSRNRLGAVEVR
ncbi:MAG: VWA domain-containing protein [Salana multivorans]|uniref:vWA domain-containing protein n=1 Tax=Salana multivorans TaxID=120377 RepID=UPI000967A72A|nr:vWA domain-containing protein [Salana multivorans]MBN8882126.1 VWA domain-containing protein [Salana multivorans]OJX95449.1 MAG: hypothetical protein BGO96_11540 [Micrococcales bacterium 73-15]